MLRAGWVYLPTIDVSGVTPDVKRQLLISGGFLNDHASTADPKAFVYAFDGVAFPNTPVIQPRLGSVEEWTYVNHNNDEHPIHIHVNDFQLIHYFDPTTGLKIGPEMTYVDNVNVPAPTMGALAQVTRPTSPSRIAAPLLQRSTTPATLSGVVIWPSALIAIR